MDIFTYFPPRSRLRAEATRKTLMPAMVHFCEASTAP